MSEDYGLRLGTPAFFADPYPTFERMRSEDPVHWSPALGRWHLTRYADIDALLREPRWSANRVRLFLGSLPTETRKELQPLEQALVNQMLFADPPDHTRLRSLVGKAFTPRVVERLRPRIAAIVNELLDQVAATHRMDAIRDFAYPLPAIVICELLGVPSEEREQFKHWSSALAAFLGNYRRDPEIDRQALATGIEAADYFRITADRLREQPRDDLLSLMVAAEEQGDRLSVEELLANSVLLLGAGHETTTNLIGNGLLALLRNSDQRRRLQNDLSLMPMAVEEFLRYESPVQVTSRGAPEDVEIGGKRIAKGSLVNFWIAAANRDPERFAEPNQLDVERQNNRHLAFGAGIHFCLGAPLARLEGQIAFTTLLERMPNMKLATDTVEWQPNISFRGLTALSVTW